MKMGAVPGGAAYHGLDISSPRHQDTMQTMTDAAVPAGSPDSGAAPARGPRLLALDATRAAAIVGMIAVNVGPRTGDGPAAFLYHLPLGRASLLFMLLAGIGMSLLTRSARRPGGSLPWPTILWRAALLLAAGLALQPLPHDVSVILPTYGLLFMACLPLLKAPTRIVAAVTGILFAAGPVAWIALQVATGETYDFTAPSITDSAADILHGIVLSGPYPAIIWAAPFLAGLLLGRADLGNRALQKRLAWWGAATAAGGYLLYRALVALLGQPGDAMGFDHLVSGVNHSQMPLWILSGTGSAVFVLGAFLLCEAFVAEWLGALVSAGQLSLTIYVGHLVWLAALVRPEPHYLYEGIFITIAMSLAALVFADIWTSRFKIGPLERLLHWPARKTSRS
jgi:uncharacterized membrane protein YeiB